jgi:hypothetical protein
VICANSGLTSANSDNVPVVRQDERKISEMIQSISSIETTNRNPGIVPPWLTKPQAKNPGIVPPWLLEPITILPVDEPEFHILPVDGETQFVSESVDASPASLADALRGR